MSILYTQNRDINSYKYKRAIYIYILRPTGDYMRDYLFVCGQGGLCVANTVIA